MALCTAEVTAPSQADEGDLVQVSVKVTNIDPNQGWGFRTELWAQNDLLGEWHDFIPSGQSKTYTGSFYMPAAGVRIIGAVWRVISADPYQEVGCSVGYKDIAYAPARPDPCIISLGVPGTAEEGTTVNVSTVIANYNPASHLYKIEMWADSDLIGSIEDTIPAYSSRTYNGSFTMPARNVVVLIWVQLSWGGRWVYDNSKSEIVELYVPVPSPEFRDFALSEYTK